MSGHLGTVRYVGHLPVWGPDVLAYGIEWDDPSRGKNNGEVGGIAYFTPHIPGSGSFLKASNAKIDAPVLLMDALLTRYAGKENEEFLGAQYTIGTKVVEKLGFLKLNSLLKDIYHLKTIMLDKQTINLVGHLPMLEAVEYLDLSFNLLTSWPDLQGIFCNVPHLQTLNLNGNCLNVPTELIVLPLALQELLLASTECSWQHLRQLDFNQVKKLNLASNSLTADDITKFDLGSIDKLDLSFNRLERIPSALSTLSIRELVLADNQLEQLPNDVFPSLRVLDLLSNKIADWSTIDRLSDLFPNLLELRIGSCSLFDNMTVEEQAWNLIGRVECSAGNAKADKGIFKLNGSTLNADEITNAELYFISRVNRGELAISNEKRWQYLLQKHQIHATQVQLRPAYSDTVTLRVRRSKKPLDEWFSRIFLKTNTVLRLKGIIARKLQRSVLDFSIYYYVSDDWTSYNAVKQYLDDDIANLENLALSDDQVIFVEETA